jgi:hypothetical protein
MLRKLFISLLILSALTSDGSMILLQHIYNNPNLYSSMGFDVLLSDESLSLAESCIINEYNDKKNFNLFSNINQKYSFQYEGYSFEPKAQGVFEEYVYLCVGSTDYIEQVFQDSLIISDTKDIVLLRSDTSPPCVGIL